MKKNLLILHGNGKNAEKIEETAGKVYRGMEIYRADNLGKAYELLVHTTMDLFVIDPVLNAAEPGDVSGIRFAERIREMEKYVLTPIIFIATEQEPQMYAYRELNCLAYLTRPYREERLKEALEKALCYRTLRNEEKTIFFKKSRIICPVKVKDIVYIDSAARRMYVHLADGKTEEVMQRTYASVLKEADCECLFQCSRGVIVNKNYILGIDFPNRYLLLKDGRGKVDIGVTYRNKILAEYGYEKALLEMEF